MPNSPEPLVQARGLCLTVPSDAGPVNILRNVDFHLGAGEAVGLVGPSGSGKTSLLMLLAGLERATAGSVVIDQTDITKLNEDQLAQFRRSRIGIVFQAFHLISTMTALENVAVPLELAGIRDAFDRAREALVSVGLGHRLTHLPSQLSGGEQQRTALARAYAPKPRLLLADEPTGDLDGATAARVFELIERLHATHGLTSILVTHNLDLAARCTRTLRLEAGRLSASDGSSSRIDNCIM